MTDWLNIRQELTDFQMIWGELFLRVCCVSCPWSQNITTGCNKKANRREHLTSLCFSRSKKFPTEKNRREAWFYSFPLFSLSWSDLLISSIRLSWLKWSSSWWLWGEHSWRSHSRLIPPLLKTWLTAAHLLLLFNFWLLFLLKKSKKKNILMVIIIVVVYLLLFWSSGWDERREKNIIIIMIFFGLLLKPNTHAHHNHNSSQVECLVYNFSASVSHV